MLNDNLLNNAKANAEKWCRLPYIRTFCKTIYLGGSIVDPYINNNNDIDYIFFADTTKNIGLLRGFIHVFIKPLVKNQKNIDVIQVRSFDNEEHSYGSYINQMMIKLCGQDHTFNFDVIDKDRKEYINILNQTKDKLLNNKIRNKKRWYQVLRGIYIMQNKSYDLTEEQAININLLHDDAENHPELIQLCIDSLEELSNEKETIIEEVISSTEVQDTTK